MTSDKILHDGLNAMADAQDQIAPGTGESVRRFAKEIYPQREETAAFYDQWETWTRPPLMSEEEFRLCCQVWFEKGILHGMKWAEKRAIEIIRGEDGESSSNHEGRSEA